MKDIRKSILLHEIFEPYNFNHSYGVDSIRSNENMWNFSKEQVQEEIKSLTEEGFLQEEPPGYWKSTITGKIHREKFIQELGCRHESLVLQNEDLSELIIALIASDHTEVSFDDNYDFNSSTLPIYLHKHEQGKICEAFFKLLGMGFVKENKILMSDSCFLSVDGRIHYSRVTIPLLGLVPPKTILAEPADSRSIFTSLNFTEEYADNLQYRWEEAERCEKGRSWLSALIMYGSILEALLLSIAAKNKSELMQSSKVPKNKDGSIKDLSKWHLYDLIEVAADLEWIDNSLSKYSQVLRDNRNLIHPEKQIKERSIPNPQTVEISKQIVLSVIISLENKNCI
jgi:hypothetical protein